MKKLLAALIASAFSLGAFAQAAVPAPAPAASAQHHGKKSSTPHHKSSKNHKAEKPSAAVSN